VTIKMKNGDKPVERLHLLSHLVIVANHGRTKD
jgi:hypothetical protein